MLGRLFIAGFGLLVTSALAVNVSAPALSSLSLAAGVPAEQVVTAFVELEPGDTEIVPGGVNLKMLFTRSKRQCLDRVICCYPACRTNRLLRARLSGNFSHARSKRLLAEGANQTNFSRGRCTN